MNKRYSKINKFCFRTIVWLLIFALLIVTSPTISLAQDSLSEALDYYNDGEIYLDDEEVSPEEISDFSDPYDGPKTDPYINMLKQSLYDDITTDTSGDIEAESAITRSQGKKYISNPIEMNSSDRRDMEKIIALANMVPDFSLPWILAEYSSFSQDDLERMLYEDPDKYKSETNRVANTFDKLTIKERALANPHKLADILGISPESLIEKLKSDQEKRAVEAALDKILDTQLDIRVIQTLNYLVKPKNHPDGGAGHWHIKVYRLRKNYTRESSKNSRESEEAYQSQKQLDELENQTIELYKSKESADDIESIVQRSGLDDTNSLAVGEIRDSSGNTVSDFLVNDENETNISAHYKGQAVDISELDDIKCTLVHKKRVGSSKKGPRPPINIKLLWQTSEGYAKDSDAIDSSFNDMFLRLSQEAIVAMLSDLDVDFADMDTINGSSFSDISAIIGQALFSQVLNSSSGDIWKFSLGDTLQKLGGIILADQLELSRQPFVDTDVNSVDDLYTAIGRYSIESNLNLPYNAMKGKNRTEMFATIARQKIAAELLLPSQSLDFDLTSSDILERLGARIIEVELGLNKDSFYNKTTLADVKGAAGIYKMNSLLSQPKGMDNYLNLANNTTSQLKSGAISPTDYCRRAAEAHFDKTVFPYKNYNPSQDITNTPTADGNINWRDEMFGFPESTIDKFITGQLTQSDLEYIGKLSLAQVLETNDANRNLFVQWLDNPNNNFVVMDVVEDTEDPGSDVTLENVALTKTAYASKIGTATNDVYSIFGTNNARGAFKRIGKKIVAQAVKKSAYVDKKVNQTLSSNSQLAETVETYQFYHSRIEKIKEHTSSLENASSELREAVNNSEASSRLKLETNLSLSNLNTAVNQARDIDSITSFMAAAQLILESSDQASQNLTELNNQSNPWSAQIIGKTNAVSYQVETISKYAYEIITGSVQNDFRVEDLSLANISNTSINLGSVNLGVVDLALFLSGQVAPKDFLLSVGSAKLGDELNIPPKALSYVSKILNKTFSKDVNQKDVFFRTLGASIIEELTDLTSGSIIDDEYLEKNISIVKIRDKIAKKQNNSKSKANTILAEALNLKGVNLEYLMRGDFGAWSSARSKAEENDAINNLPVGTTEKFIRGEQLGKGDQSQLSDDEIRQLATKLEVSESAIRTFLGVKNGQENPAINKIYFVDYNKYLSTNDTADSCAAKTIPDNSYLYYDSDGMHHFNSYAAANEYRKVHKDQELDYLEEISLALSNISSSIDKDLIKNDLGIFLADLDQSWAFGNESTYQAIEQLLELSYDINPATTEKVFTRKNSDESSSLDYLKISGYSLIKNFATSYLNQSLGLSLGPAEITPDDIYEILNGNTGEVFAKIGGSILDQEMGMTQGSIQRILDSENSDQRRCNMERAGIEILGDIINISGLKLDGSLFNNFGGRKIENFLGFPEGSFRGNNFSELMDNVPIHDLIRAFKIPVPKNANDIADNTLKAIGDDYYKFHHKKNFVDKAQIINNYVTALGNEGLADNLDLFFAWFEIDQLLINTVVAVNNYSSLWESKAMLSALELYEKPEYSGYTLEESTIMWQTFKSRLAVIDAGLGLDSGHTTSLLQDKISPDNYRKEVSDQAIAEISLTTIKGLFGLDDVDISIVDFNQFIRAIKEPGDLSPIYSFLDKIFSLNLDKKAGFSNGTFSSIVQSPNNTISILLKQGARMLDKEILREASDDNSTLPYSFENFIDVFTQNNDEDIKACSADNIKSFSDCMNSKRFGSSITYIESATKFVMKETITGWITSRATEASGINLASGTSFRDDIQGIFNGDFRPLMILGVVKGIKSLTHDDDGNLAVSDNFRFSYNDIYMAFYSNTNMENYARERAYAQVINQENDENYDWNNLGNGHKIKDDFSTIEDVPNTPGAVMPPNAQESLVFSSPTISLNNLVQESIDLSIPISAGASLSELGDEPRPPTRPVPPKDPPDGEISQEAVDEFIAESNGYQLNYIKWQNDHALWQRAYNAGELAAQEVQGLYRKHLEYKTVDALLRKTDDKIPAGFAWAMYQGNGYVRTSAMLSYLENIILSDSGLSDYLPEGSFNALHDYFDSDSGHRGNVDLLINRTGLKFFDGLDNYFVSHAPKIFGMSLEPGTAQALFGFLKNGSLDSGITIGGKEYKSLNDLYDSNWVTGKICAFSDDKLGLPSGMSYQLYSSFQSIRSAQQAIHIWSNTTVYESLISRSSVLQDQLTKTEGGGVEFAKDKLNQSKIGLKTAKAEMVSIIVNLVFAKEIASAEQKLNMVPGTGAMAMGMLTQLAFGLPVEPITIGIFVLMNMFGTYKTYLVCTADGHYPKLGRPIDDSIWDNAGLGDFNGQAPKIREKKFIEAAQYKASRLIADLYEMPARTGNDDLVPTQVMTGRVEDVYAWQGLLPDTICKKVGARKVENGICRGTKAGLWANPQTIQYTHIGF